MVNQLCEEPKSGAIFAFINKHRTLLKIEDGRIEIDNKLVENAGLLTTDFTDYTEILKAML